MTPTLVPAAAAPAATNAVVALDVALDVAAATPGSRDRWVDALRVGSLLVVVLGHWLMGALTPQGEATNVLAQVPALQPLTWLLQVMPLFFLVGGVAHAHALASAARVGGTARGRYAAFVRGRAGRLLRPTLAYLVVWLLLGVLAHVSGLAASGAAPVVTAVLQLSTQLLWFVGVYLGVAALAPATHAWHRRSPALAVVLLVAGAGVVDLVRFGTGQTLVGTLNFALVWLALHQLGYCWKDGMLTRRVAGVMVGLGASGLLVAVTVGPYPVSMVGVPGEAVSNMAPPTVALLCQGLVVCGLAVLLRGPMTRLLARPRVWGAVVVAGAVAMTAFLWHLTALMVVMLGARLVGADLPEPGTATWWLTRPLWVVVLVLPTLLLVRVMRRFDAPRPTSREPFAENRSWTGALAAVGTLVTVAGVMMVSVTGIDVVAGPERVFLVTTVTPAVALLVLAAGLAATWLARPRRQVTSTG
jgi:fucose 4-O-acetylase-like acetyltransferase